MSKNYLFYTRGYLRDYLERKTSEIREEIYKLDEDYIPNVSEEDLIRTLIEKHTLCAPNLKIDEKYSLEPKEIDVDVSRDPNRLIFDRSRPFYIKGTLITVVIPFEGDEELFYYQPSTFSTINLKGIIYGNELHLEYTLVNHDQESLKKEVESDIQQIQAHLIWVKNEVNNFNNSLENYLRNLIKTRKEKLLKDRNLVRSLDIPIKHREENIIRTFAIPITRKRIKIEFPKVKTEKFRPEPTLRAEIYDEILDIIKNMALVMERSPRAFSKMSEENLRDHFLVQLNGQYEGQAMGEVFNYQGKTDILIRHENANVFIAECKFWRGEKKVLETIDQLLKYVTWRDTKTAILLFNREGNLTEILKKIPEIVKKHACYKRERESKTNETSFRYIFHHPDDTNREIILTIVVFNIPKL
jgi:hypothetical protein